MLAKIRRALPGPKRLAGQVGLVLGVSVLVGAFLFHIFTGLHRFPEQWPRFLWNVYYTLIYAAVMVTSLKGAIALLKAHVPLRSRRAVALHVGGLSVVTVVSYGLATGLCWVLHPGFDVSGPVLLVTATVGFAVTLIWSAFAYMRAFYERLREAEAARYEARLAALRAQINPHFLFNAFNSIAALVRTRPDEAETVVEDLSALFRYALQASEDGDRATLGEEIEAARCYLSVEKARFRDRLAVEIEVPAPLRSVPVPSMTVQPLVENAVKHGVSETAAPCRVTVSAERVGNALVLRVIDTGPGFDATDLDAVVDEGSGLANVRERLALFYGPAAEMRLLPQGVELRAPVQEEREEPLTSNFDEVRTERAATE